MCKKTTRFEIGGTVKKEHKEGKVRVIDDITLDEISLVTLKSNK